MSLSERFASIHSSFPREASLRGVRWAAFVSCLLIVAVEAQENEQAGDVAGASAADSVPDGWLTQLPEVMPAVAIDQADESTDREAFRIQSGFRIERLFDVPQETHGSWVSLAFDDAGRLLASDEGRRGISRIYPSPLGSDEPTRVEKLDGPMTAAQGMLYAFDSLYLSVNGRRGSGLYRARDLDGDGQFEQYERLAAFRGSGEHGPHALRLSPDGQSIYVVCGNHTDPPEPIDASRILTRWGEDLLLPRQWDARGHARGRLAPGGWIAKTDPRGETWEIISIGYRNVYDIAFDPEGELFAYDADMEWDFGMPWYRPTRLLHAVSGSEFGWRSGTGKWPSYFVDSLPSVVDIGPGSPTGVTFGTGARFPDRYQRALYLLDWTFGTMYAVHLQPEGASYRAVKEEFLARAALPLTDAVIGPDGALYFAVGGRGTQSALYRVTYTGDESTEPAVEKDNTGAELRALRRQLEAFHPTVSTPRPEADMDRIWESLGHDDRFVRYAARVALERQPIDAWQPRLAAETDARRAIQAVVALARAGSDQRAEDTAALAELKREALRILLRIDLSSLALSEQLDLLRAYALVFIRLGKPSVDEAAECIARLDAHYPHASDTVNRELARVMVYLNAPSVVQKTLALMRKDYAVPRDEIRELLSRNPGYGRTIEQMYGNHPELDKLYYAFVLRNVRYGWTLEERREYLEWLNRAKQRSGGESYEGFIENMRRDALENLSDEERLALESDTLMPPPSDEELPKPQGPGQAWTTSAIVALAQDRLQGRDFENGKRAYAASRCIVCHRFNGRGGSTGPDLTSVAGRFSLADLVEALVEPSKVVSDQYRASVIATHDGRSFVGRVVNQLDDRLVVQTHPEDASQVTELEMSNVESLEPSPTSLMPERLVDVLNQEELLDLLAFLLSRGNPDDRMFQRIEQTTGK